MRVDGNRAAPPGVPDSRAGTGTRPGTVPGDPEDMMAIGLVECDLGVAPRLAGALAGWAPGEGMRVEQAAARAALQPIVAHRERGLAWLIEQDGEPVGYAIVELGVAHGFLWREARLAALWLCPAVRGRGTALLARRAVRDLLPALGAALVAESPPPDDRHWTGFASAWRDGRAVSAA